MKTTKDLYFDWAATAPVDEDICREATEVALTYYGNPSSEHLQGSESKKILEFHLTVSLIQRLMPMRLRPIRPITIVPMRLRWET